MQSVKGRRLSPAYVDPPRSNASWVGERNAAQPEGEVWNPWTGDIWDALFTRKGARYSVDVTLPPFGSELLAFDDAGHKLAGVPAMAWQESNNQVVGDTGWSIDTVGDSEKGVDAHEHLDMAKLTD